MNYICHKSEFRMSSLSAFVQVESKRGKDNCSGMDILDILLWYIWIFSISCYNMDILVMLLQYNFISTFSSKLWYWWAGNQLLKQLVSFRVESREENQMMLTEKTTLVSNEIDIQWPSFPQALDRFLGSDQTWGKIVSSSYFPSESKRKMPFSPSSGKWPIWVF